ncbi:chromosome transmission fidelity protein 8 [Flammula alnicola]|nr:chromosome transmission fidelity protein 8 [Flammula alnicola]
MLIPITLPSSSSTSSHPKLPSGLVKISHDEIVLVELQGWLEVEVNNPSERNGKLVGKLKIDETTNKPSLLIGHHLLEGKIATLPKPYAVLLRNGSTRGASESESEPTMQTGDDDDDEAMAVDAAGSGPESSIENGHQGSSAGWTIAGIVKKKIIFSKRPMPVIEKK